jgi:hypothetical protein
VGKVWPRAPEKSIGLPIAIRYGKLRDVPARIGTQWNNSFQHGMVSAAGGQRGMRGVLVSAGRGSAGGTSEGEKALVLFAGHACKVFNDETAGCTPLIQNAGKLGDLDPIGGDVVNSATDGTGFKITDITSGGTDPFTAFFPVLPVDETRAASNNAENTKAALEAFNETSYTYLDYDAGYRSAQFQIPNVGAAGSIREIRLLVGLETSHALGGGPPAGHVDINGVGGNSGLSTAATSGPVADSVQLNPANWPTIPWDLNQTYVTAYFDGAATGRWIKIYYLALAIRYRPEWPIITPQQVIEYWAPRKHPDFSQQGGGEKFYEKRQKLTDVIQRVDSQFFATLDGYADTGGGTYTGTASALIERPPDILNHILQTYLGQSGGQIETGASAFGSLVKARDYLKTWNGADMILSVGIPDFIQASDLIANLGTAALSWPYISRFDDKWHFCPWQPEKAVDYDYVLAYDRQDVLSREGVRSRFASDLVVNDLEVRYTHDEWGQRDIHATYVGSDQGGNGRSSSGYIFRNLRDESFKVITSVNDRINFGAFTATLTAGDYTGATFIAEAQTRLRAADSANIAVSWGFYVVAAYNDTIDCTDNGDVARTVTLTAGYMTAEQRASDVQAKIRAACSDNSWTCTYSRTTRKFTIERPGGGATANDLFFGTGPNKAKSAGPMLGFDYTDIGASTAVTSNQETEEEWVTIMFQTARSLLWETGADGLNAATPRPAAALFGHDGVRDRATANFHTPITPKNSRELTCSTSALRYGKKRQKVIEGRYISDTQTAREVRNRIIAFLAEPPLEIRFPTDRMVDLERGRIFQLSSDWDAVFPCPVPGSDGSWAGKKWVFVEMLDHLMGGMHQEIRAFYVP